MLGHRKNCIIYRREGRVSRKYQDFPFLRDFQQHEIEYVVLFDGKLILLSF